jgi:hypothetical protein
MRCKECRDVFEPKYFLQKTCSDECEDKYRKHTPVKRINKVSPKTQALNDEYHARIKVWIIGKICPVTGKPATEVHHTNGREYQRLLDEDYWLGVTRFGHAYIHNNPKEAREKGWLL